MKKFCFLCLFIVLLAACQNNDHLYENKLYVFGTLVNIHIWHHNEQQVHQAMDDINQLFKQMHHHWHAWKPGRLHDINTALRAGQSIQLTPREAGFIEQVIRLSRQTNHYFNPAIGELINLWGFHTDNYPITTPPPRPEAIQALAQQQISVGNLHLDGLMLSADNPHIWLDFGGIAKGLAVDLAIDIIREYGIDNAIVNAGGDLRSIGHKGDRDWRIGIQSPDKQGIFAVLPVNDDEAVFTSGNYQRYKVFDHQRYPHIIDGRTGLPVQDMISATVIAQDGVTADAAATALIVAGSDHWQQVADNLQLDQILIINGQQQCQATEALYRRLQELTIECQIVRLTDNVSE